MMQSNGNNTESPVALEESEVTTSDTAQRAPAPPGAAELFATRSKMRPRQNLAQSKVVLMAGGAVGILLLLFVFSSSPAHKSVSLKGKQGAVNRQSEAGAGEEGSDAQKSLFPVIESGRPPAKDSRGGLIGEQDVEQTATRQPKTSMSSPQPRISENGTLGSIPPFESETAWQPRAYQPVSSTGTANADVPKSDREQPSLVFVRKVAQSGPSTTTEPSMPDPASSLGLPTGTRLRARLEAAASTAIRTPVIAVIEYNYERGGEIVIPAGTRAFGQIEQADRSGYMSFRFDSLLMPDGSRTGIDAVATNLSLGPLRGKVEGKNSGKNALVRSLSGIGEVAALFLGGGGASINQPFSEGDLVRERLSTNIGESADQEVTRLSITEHIVVSLSAGTPIYVVLDRSSKRAPAVAEPRGAPANSMNSVESLRQLLQLQRELNQSSQTSQQ
jgi:hypothetical protein